MPVVSSNYYPSVTELIPKGLLPEKLAFIQEGLEKILKELYYKDLQLQKAPNSEAAWANLSLISYTRLGFEFPGTNGLALVLNPAIDSQDYSEFPISIGYRLEILKYIRNFKFSNFLDDPQGVFELIIQFIKLDNYGILNAAIAGFFNNENGLEEYVNLYNSKRSPSITLDEEVGNDNEIISDLVSQITMSQSLITVIFEDLILANTFEVSIENIKRFTSSLLGKFDMEDLKKLITPKLSASINDISVALEFPRTLFKPLDNSGNVIDDDPSIPDEDKLKTRLSFDVGALSYNTEEGFIFQNISTFDFHKSRILDSGFTLELTGVSVDLSRTSNIPEATADGRPVDFIGAYITEGIIGFPQFWNHDDANSTGQLIARNLLVGTGGISGTIGLEAKTNGNPSPLISASFGEGFKVSLNAFDLTFQQNSIIESNIHGSMKIPGFKDASGDDAEINIDAWIGTNGEFSVTASEDQGITALSIPDVLDVRIDSLTVGRKEDRFYVAVSGAIEFADLPAPIGQFLPDAIDVQKLIIWEDGQIEYEGGTLVLPNAISLKIGPVELSITAIGLGSHQQMHDGIERKYKFFEFSGGININPGGVDARGDGIKFYFTVDDDEVGQSKHFFIRIQGIAIDIMIPGSSKPEDAALLLSGYLAMKDPQQGNEAAGTEYAGGIEFTLPRLEMKGSASMRLNPKVPAFIVDIGLELSSPIPLGATGLGIYGFRALIGQRYVATKSAASVPDDGPWWQYYKAKISPDYKEGVQVSKFDQTNGFSLGAGVSLATASDAGKTFSTKLFFLLSLPEVFMFQGQGQILKERIGLDETNDPPFFAMLSISKQSVETAFGINYKLPDDKRPGSIAKVDALIEMGFFFGNSSGWYVNIGKDLPESRRVNVRLLELFDAYFYLMISASGIRAGAGAKFELNKKFGPLKAELSAYLDVAGRIAFKPKQYGASIQMGGKVGLYIFKFGFSISVDAGLAAEAPKPFIVTGSLKACVKVLRKDRCAQFQFSWVKENGLDQSEIQIIDRNVAAKAINMQTRETFDLYSSSGDVNAITTDDIDNVYDNSNLPFAIPMDSFIDIEFLKGVKPSTEVKNKFGGNTQGVKYTDYVSPQKAKHSRVLHEYHLEDINIYSWNGDVWELYDIYEAATPLSIAEFVTTDLTNLKKGYWQYQQANLHNKLRIMAQSPLSFLSQGSGLSGGVVVEDLGITTSSIYCPPDELVETCVNFNELGQGDETGQVMMVINQEQVYHFNPHLFKITGGNSDIVYRPFGNFYNALKFNDTAQLNIVFNEPMSFVSLLIQSEADSITIRFYSNVLQQNLAPTNLPQFDYQLVETRTISASQLNNPIIYNNINEVVDKVVVTGDVCNGDPDLMSLICNDELTDQAKEFQNFLNVQLLHGQLTENISLYPDEHSIYNGVFQGTSLYSELVNPDLVLSKFVEEVNESSLHFSISDRNRFICKFHLQTGEDQAINWEEVAEFKMIRPFNQQNGQNYQFEIDAIMQNGETITLSGDSCYPIIECKYICNSFLYQVCTLSFENAQYNETLPDQNDIQNEIDSLTEGFNKSIQPIWRPNTYYAIEIKTNDNLLKDGNSYLTNYSNTNVFAFKTKGPIGFFHQDNLRYERLEQKDREAEFKFANLQHYIDFEKSYPNADGALIKAKPLFYVAPRLNLFYLKNYVFEFYRNWNEYNGNDEVQIDLETTILDPAPDTTQPLMPPLSVQWEENALPGFIIEASTLNNMVENGDPCVDVNLLEPIGVNSYVEIDELKPLKLYTALFEAKYKLNDETPFSKQEVHRYVFQTSRYANFEAQIKSYILERDPNDNSIITKEAVFAIELADISTTEINTALEVITDNLNSTNSLFQAFADKYDRLMDGVLKAGALHPAVTTEFNVIKSETTGNILGILIRNPEPFNDPKIPLTDMLGTVSGTEGSNSLDSKVFSKDNRSAFLTNATMNIPHGTYQFDFEYKQWAGDGYEPKSSVSVNIDLN